MSFEVAGKLMRIFPVEEKSPTFKTRDIVLEVPDGNYMQMVKFQLTQDKVSLADIFKEGEMVKVSFNLRGREWQGKYFTNLDAWRIERAGSEQQSDNDPFGEVTFPEVSNDAPHQDTQDDDLPF